MDLPQVVFVSSNVFTREDKPLKACSTISIKYNSIGYLQESKYFGLNRVINPIKFLIVSVVSCLKLFSLKIKKSNY